MQKTYRLVISHDGKTQYVQLDGKKPVKVKAKANTKYQIYNGDEITQDVRIEIVGNDAYITLPNQQEIALVLENYQHYVALGTMDNTANTINLTELMDSNTSPVAITSTKSKLGLGAIAMGLGAVGMGAAAFGGNSGGKKNTPTPKAEPKQVTKKKAEVEADDFAKNPPKITFDHITEDNIINQNESQATLMVTGFVENSKTGDILTVTIGMASQNVVVVNGKFSLKLDGKTLIVHDEISATLTRNGREIGTKTHQYQVDTQIDAPTIKFNNITDDNVINLNESNGKIIVSGTVDNAKDGDEIIISCGCPACTGVEWVDIKTTVQNGGFSVDFKGVDMVARGRTTVKASVTTTDDAKNTATGTAEKTYSVDITPPDPSFVYDKIGEKNIINAKVAENDIILRGKVVNLGENETIMVKVTVNGKDHFATKNGEYYQISVPSIDFANDQVVKWHLTAKDKAGNEKIIEQYQSYAYDITLNQPTIEIDTNNQIVNMTTRGLTLSGTLNFDDDVLKSSAKVDIVLNGKTHSATVNTDTKTWSLNLSEKLAKQNQGNNDFIVKVSVADAAGNVAENQSIGHFVVDTAAPQITVTLNDIGQITQIGTEKVTLSGTVTGEFKPSNTVKVSVNGTEFVANITKGGAFSVEVPRTTLIQNASKKISASLDNTDDAGNIGIATTEQNYTVISSPNSPKQTGVELDSLANDDVINVTESKIAKTKITGTAENAEGQTVAITIGNSTHHVEVKKGTFSLDVDTKTLVENKDGKILASLNGQISERTYKVDNFVSAQIKINEMTDIMPSTMVRLTGKIQLDGLFAKYQNPIQLQSFVAKLNDKEYAVAVNTKTQTFSWDIDVADLHNAQGKEISFVNKGGVSIYDYQNDKVVFQSTPQLATSNYQFDANPYVANGLVKRGFELTHTKINGQVSGSAKAGDTVAITIGKEIVLTKVQNDLSFVAMVNNDVLKQADKLSATLSTKNHQGQAITINTEYTYQTGAGKAKGEFISKFITPSDNELPYFIKATETDHKEFGYLKRFKYGQGAEITYSFNKEYHQARDWTYTNRKAVRDALANYAKYADIKFVELPDNSGVNVPNGVGRADIEFHHRPLYKSAGVADFGGNVHISTSHHYMNNRNGFHLLMHEIGHSLGMKHTHETPNALNHIEDNTGLSVMSYRGTQMDVDRWDLRLFDIAFAQYRYGVNKTQRTGNDTYTFKAFNTQVADGNVYIWDGAGVDTFDASKEKERVTVDLNPGSWIYRGEKTANFILEKHEDLSAQQFLGTNGYINDPQRYLSQGKGKYTFTEGQAFIGYGTQLERLIGSDFNDRLKGNIADNEIFGGAGDDFIEGRDGHDYLDGGQGVDTMHGGRGDDVFIVDNVNDVVVENYLEGTDTVYSHAQSYKLSPNVENISLLGVAKIAIGNELDNRITGNELSNTLTGGAGKDTFVFSNLLNGSVDTITDFNVSEDSIALSSSVFEGLTKDTIKDHIKYDQETGAISYDKDGNGEADGVHFATLQNKPNLTVEEIHFILI